MAATQYQGSQAFNQTFAVNESVTRNTGSLVLSTPVVNLRGVRAGIGLVLNLSYSPGATGSLGLPQNWGFGLALVVPDHSVTAQGRTNVIDPNWTDSTGYQSGLRYVNDHGTKFSTLDSAKPLPSGRPGTYSLVLASGDGCHDYFDAYGKLLEHDDLFGNAISYSYTQQFATPFDTQLAQIVDSFGQTVQFAYGANTIVITAPDGSATTITYASQGVVSVQDALGNQTCFTYITVANQSAVSQIFYPTGLVTTFHYATIAYNSLTGQAAFPAVSDHIHADAAGNVLDHTGYAFGTGSGGNTFTGFGAGYLMSTAFDSLMDSNNTAYLYDVLVQRFDGSGTVLAASRVFYNYLHLPMQEQHYLVGSGGTLANADCYQALYTYAIDPNFHARTASFALPVQTQQSVFLASSNTYVNLRQQTASYDAFGQILTAQEFIYDTVTQQFVSRMSTANSWTAAAWGGEMPAEEIHTDSVTGRQRRIRYTLTADQTAIASAEVARRDGPQAPWAPWKTRSYGYDASGRVTTTTLAWSHGVTPPPGSPASSAAQTAYSFDPGGHAYRVATTDALGRTTWRTYAVGVATGPLVQRLRPMGEADTWGYDALGRRIVATDALGFTSRTTYALAAPTFAAKGGTNSAVTTGPTGYVVAHDFDAHGRVIQVMDNGDATQPPASTPNRVLRTIGYDALGRRVQTADALGLVTHYAYDSLNRIVSTIDPLGNAATVAYDDAGLTTTRAVNGVQRRVTQLDGLGRPIVVTRYPDPDDTSGTPLRVYRTQYDGFGDIDSATVGTLARDGTDAQTLYQSNLMRDVEGAVVRDTMVGSGGAQVTVTRDTTYDLLGHAVARQKQTVYADGRTYNHQGSTLAFDAAGQCVALTNAIGQTERYAYDEDGRPSTLTRFDGSAFRYLHDYNGQLTGVVWPDGEGVKYNYLPNGLTASVFGPDGAIAYDYYLDGTPKSVTYPGGAGQGYQIDRASRVIAATDPSGGTTLTRYDSQGRVEQRQYGGESLLYQYGTVNHVAGAPIGDRLTGRGVVNRQVAYDGYGAISAVTSQDGDGKMLLSARYARDGARRLTGVTLSSQRSSDPAVNQVRTAAYDGLGQLTGVSTAYADGHTDTIAFAYDGNGNVASRSLNGSARTFTYNAIDQLTVPGVTYDANGRMLADGSRTYTYNAVDKITAVAASDGAALAAYAYHADDSLAGVTVGEDATDFYYRGGTVTAAATSQAGGAPAWTGYLIDATGRRGAYPEGQPPSHYVTSRGSTSLVQQGAAPPTALSHDPYGAAEGGTTLPADTSFTWNQEYADPASGLVYLRARYYNPALMAFMSMDSLHRENRYGYCAGDPLNLIDPTGHSEVGNVFAMVAGAVVGIIATVLTEGAAAPVAAAVFGTETVAASTAATISVGAVSGAVGSLAGDATTAGLSGQRFTAERALIDVAVGALDGGGGAGVGASVGAAAGRAAMSAVAGSVSDVAANRISMICSVGVGALAGVSIAAAGSGVVSLATRQRFWSVNTAVGLAAGAAAGAVAGGMAAPEASPRVPAASEKPGGLVELDEIHDETSAGANHPTARMKEPLHELRDEPRATGPRSSDQPDTIVQPSRRPINDTRYHLWRIGEVSPEPLEEVALKVKRAQNIHNGYGSSPFKEPVAADRPASPDPNPYLD
jgi:RHS repeat-associated protein